MGLLDRVLGRQALRQRVNALEAQVHTLRTHGFGEFLAGFGDEVRDPVERLEFRGERVLTRQASEDLYQFNGVAAGIVDIPPDDATRKGVDLLDGDTPLDEVENALAALPVRDGLTDRRTGALVAINRGLKLARFMRAGVLVAGIRDGQHPWEPVDYKNIDAVDKVYVHHAYEMWPHSYNPDGSVAIYQLAPDASMGEMGLHRSLVHASRTYPLPGIELTAQRQQRQRGWPDSALQRAVRALLRDDFVADQATRLTSRKNVQAYSTPGLKNQVELDNGEALRNRLRQIWQAMSLLRVFPMDSLDSVTTLDASLDGLADLLDRYPHRVSAASRIPVTRLYGMSPGGLNSTGEYDEANYLSMVMGSLVTLQVVPAYAWLALLVMLSHQGPTGGRVPEGFRAEPRPLKEQTEKDKAETAFTEAKTDDLRLKQGVVSREQIAELRGFELPPAASQPPPADPPPAPTSDPDSEARANALRGQLAAGLRVHAGPGDGSLLAVMIPARHLAEHLPDVEEPHVTLCYLPDTAGRAEEALQVIGAVIAEHGKPFRCSLGRLDHLFTPEGLVAFFLPVWAEGWVHETLRDRLVDRLQAAGFAVGFPRCWVPHLTLKVEADPRASYTGTPPQSSWWVNTLEVWGLEEVQEIKLDRS